NRSCFLPQLPNSSAKIAEEVPTGMGRKRSLTNRHGTQSKSIERIAGPRWRKRLLRFTMNNAEGFLFDHQQLTQRYFFRVGAAGVAACGFWPRIAGTADSLAPELAKALKNLEP